MKFKDAVNEIFNRIDIVDVVGEYVHLKRVGSNYMGCCPFHNEKTPSFSVSESRKTFLCFGCKKSGNVIQFVQERLGLTYPEAVRMLAKRIGIEVEDDYENNAWQKELKEKRDKLYSLTKDLANEYYKVLYSEKGKVGLEYFKSRNLTKDTIFKFGLGFAPNEYGYMYNIMKEKGYEDDILLESKLFRLNKEKTRIFDAFYNRVMFPIKDTYNHVVGFQSRSLEKKPEIRKYVNSEDNLIFHKGSLLYAMNFALSSQKDYYILCEGNMDVITLHQSGYDNAIASMGTAFNEKQIPLLKRKLKKVYLCQDNDDSGVNAVISSYKLLKKADIATYVIDLNPVKDVDELINKYGVEIFKERVEHPIPTHLFYASSLKRKYNIDDENDLKNYLNDIITFLSDIDNSIIREQCLKHIAKQEKLDYLALKKLMDNSLKGNTTKVDTSHIDESNKKTEYTPSDLDTNFINLIYLLPDKKEKISEIIKEDELIDDYYRELYRFYLSGNEKAKIYSDIENHSEADKKILTSILDTYMDVDKNNVESIIFSLNQIIKQIKIRELNKKLNSATDKFEIKNKTNEINKTKYL